MRVVSSLKLTEIDVVEDEANIADVRGIKHTHVGQAHDDSGEHEDDESNHIHDECSIFGNRSVGMGLSG